MDILNMTKDQWVALLASYARSVFAGAATLYLAGVTDPLTMLWSLLVAIAPVAIRAINPADTAFGRLPNPEDIEAAASKAKKVNLPK